MIVMVMTTSGVLAAFNPSILLRASSFAAWIPDLAASGVNIVVAWDEMVSGTPVTVWVRRSTNSGGVFGAPVRLFKNPANAAREIAVFSGPTAHVAVWSEDVAGGGSRVFMSRATFGGAWSAAVQVSTNTGATRAHRPQIALSGTVLVLTYHASPTEFSGPYSAYTRVKVGNGAWGAPTSLAGGLEYGTIRLAVTSSRVLAVWTNGAGQVRARRGAITNAGTAFAWFTGYQNFGTGQNPIVVMSGTRAVVIWEHDSDIYHRRSSNSGTSWGSASRILDGNPNTETDAGNPYGLSDAAMNNADVVVTADAYPDDEPGEGYRVTSSDNGATWTVTLTSLAAADRRQVAFTRVGGVPKLAETWLRVQGQTYPYQLRFHRET